MRKINIKQLRVFVEVCESSSFTKAAKKLYMTQQAVSHTISALENSLGCALFSRDAGRLNLTESGEFLKANCKALLREDDLLQYKMLHRFDATEIIQVGYGFGMLRNLPIDLFSSFHESYPHYQIHGSEMLNLTCEKEVESGELDVGFTIGPVDESRFSSITLYRDNYVAIMESDNPLAKKPLISINDLRGEGIICNSGKNRHLLVKYCENTGFEPNIIHCCTDLISQMYLCHNSANIVITVDQLLDRMFKQYPSLCKVYFDDSIYPWELCLITKKRPRSEKSINAFISHVLKKCSDN